MVDNIEYLVYFVIACCGLIFTGSIAYIVYNRCKLRREDKEIEMHLNTVEG